nr:unnamed protein product [Digitaria exilis]
MSDGSVVTGISIDDGIINVLKPSNSSNAMADTETPLYAFSEEWGMVKWAVDSMTCKDAMSSESYRCFSHSDCVDVTEDKTLKQVGYRCKCSRGFEGNPYLKDGCTDIDECLQPDKYICKGICQNTFGSYTCNGCPHGTDFNDMSRKCKPSTVILGVTVGLSSGGGILFLAAVVLVLTRRWKRNVQKQLRKRSKLEESTEIEQFINEVSILSRINHRNVVKLHGCCLEAEVPLLVYEFVPNGTLYDLLHREKNGILLPLSWEERLRIAIEIAGALTYLHSEASVSILHRDVKCMNILLNDSYTAKVSDFGASRSIPIDQTHLLTAVQGTFGYLDPQYYYTGQLNEKSDVYSFGVILLELLTRNKPIFVDENGEKQNLSNYFLWATSERPLEKVVDKQILEEASEEAIVGTAQLAEECLSLTRGERPTMKEVEMRLQMLRTCQAVAPRARMDEVPRPRCESAKTNGIARSVPVDCWSQRLPPLQSRARVCVVLACAEVDELLA